MSEILEIRESLLRLLDQVASRESVHAELTHARREFFGAEQPLYAKGEESMELAAIRFAEWFLLERSSDQLGDVPVKIALETERLADASETDLERLDCMATSRVSVFISESLQADRLQVRDLQGGERLELISLPTKLDPGDILVGRLYEHGGGAWVPSVAMAILPASPELAVAYQKDLRQLELKRRLTQSELEHLLFRRWADHSAATSPSAPLEHLEAELEGLLASSNMASDYPVAEISAALQGLKQPGAVIAPILDQLAFDSEIDIDELRRLLQAIWVCRREREQDHIAKSRPKPKVRFARKPRVENSDLLGKQIAARLDDGLGKKENLESLFQELAAMIGEGSLEDEAEGELSGADVGDLEPLLCEFAWEEALDEEQEAILARFCRSNQNAPVPKNVIEYLEHDDLLRFLLHSWLESAPSARVSVLHKHVELLRRFFAWVARTQSMDVSALIEVQASPLVAEAERLDAASKGLSTSERPETDAGEPVQLMRVTGIENERLSLLLDEPQREAGAVIVPRVGHHLREDDLMFARFSEGDGRGRIHGMVVVIPGELQHLLG